MKRSISAVVSLILLLMAVLCLPVTASGEVKMVRVTKGASIRSQPGFKGDKIEMATVGSEYMYLGEVNGWYEIQVNATTTGYLPTNSCKLVTAAGIPTGSAQDAFSNIISVLQAGNGFVAEIPETFAGKTAIAAYYDFTTKPQELSTEALAESGNFWSIPEDVLAAQMSDADWALLLYPTITSEEDDPVKVNVFPVDIKNVVFYTPYVAGDRATVLQNGETTCDLDSMLVDLDETVFFPKWERSFQLANDEYYQTGLQYLNEGKFYSAYESFRMSSLEEAQEKAETCIQAWPATGQIWHNSSVKGTNMELTVSVNQDEDRAMIVKIYKGDVHAATLFIAGTGKATTKLPAGTYTIKDGVGTQWFGANEAFGRDGAYETMTFGDDGTSQVQLKSGHAYTITINVTNPDPNADSVGSEYQDWEGFGD